MVNKDGRSMHGVAFDSNITSVNFENDDDFLKGYEYYNQREDIKVINNSHGLSVLFDTQGADFNSFDDLKEIYESDDTLAIGYKVAMANYNKLLINANGNEGTLDPLVNALGGTVFEELKHNLIGVSAINSYFLSI